MIRLDRYLYISFFIVIVSCSNDKKKTGLFTAEIMVPEDYQKPLLHDSLIEKVSIVQLETNDKSLFGNYVQIIVKKNKFYIHDLDNNMIVIFNKDGTFVNKIHAVGKGPGEYSMVMDIRVDANGNVLILDYNKILTFDLEGKFIKSMNFDYIKSNSLSPHAFVPINDGGFYFWRGSFAIEELDKKHRYAMYRVDKKGRITDQFFPIERKIIGYFNRFYESKYHSYYMQSMVGDDVIYSVSDKGVFPVYKVNYGKKTLPQNYLIKKIKGSGKQDNDITMKTDYCIRIFNIFENEKLIYFEFESNQKTRHALYSKTSNKVIVGTTFFESLPRTVGFDAVDFETNEFVSVMDEGSLQELNSKNPSKNKLCNVDIKISNALNKKSEFSNPILVLYQLKNF